jgi:uncharacterized protein involved in outer membrane biogenesis
MKALLVILGALALVLVGAAVIGPRLVDWNRFKPEIAALAERATGRTLAIDGEVGFSLLPTPTLSAAGVHLGNPPGAAAPELMRLKSLDARIAVGPLLAGRIVVESVALVEPVVVIDTAAAPSAGGGAAGLEAELDAQLDRRLSFDRIIVVDGKVTWRTADGTIALERLNAELAADTLRGPFRAGGDVAWLGLSWRFELSTGRLDAAGPLSLSAGLRGGGATLRVTGTLTPGGGETLMAGRVRADTSRLPALLAASRLVDAGADGLPAPLGQALTLDAALDVGRARLALNDVTLTLGDDMRATGALGITLQPRATLDVTLAVNRLDVERWSRTLPAPPRRAAAEPRRVVRGTIDLTIDAVLWRGGVIRQARLNGVLGETGLTVRQAGAQLPGGSDVALFGQLTFGAAPRFDGLRFDGHFEGGADNLRGVLDWLELDVGAIPPDRLRRVSVTGGVSLAADRLELDKFDARFDASRLTGSAAAVFGPRPAVGANLRLDRLNLEAYLPRAGPTAAPAAPPREPLDWLTGFDANLQLRVDQLAYDTLPLSGVVATLGLERGVLSVHELSVEDAAGVRALLGGVVHRARWPAEVALTLSVQARDPSRFLQLVGDAAATPALGPLAATMTANGPLDQLRVALDGELAGGTLGASGVLDGAAVGGTLTLTARNLALGAIAEALTGAGGLDGRLDLDLALAASGATGDALGRSLGGTGEVHARAGALPGLDLDALAGLLQPGAPTYDSGHASGRDPARAIEHDVMRGRSAFATLDGHVTVAGTRVATDDTVAAGAAGTVALGGALDLATRQLALDLALQAAADPAAPPVRLHLAGPLAAPTRAIDAEALLAYLAARR